MSEHNQSGIFPRALMGCFPFLPPKEEARQDDLLLGEDFTAPNHSQDECKPLARVTRPPKIGQVAIPESPR